MISISQNRKFNKSYKHGKFQKLRAQTGLYIHGLTKLGQHDFTTDYQDNGENIHMNILPHAFKYVNKLYHPQNKCTFTFPSITLASIHSI